MEAKEFTKILSWMAYSFTPDFLYECFDPHLAERIENQYYDLLHKGSPWAVIELFLNVDSGCQEIIINRINSKYLAKKKSNHT